MQFLLLLDIRLIIPIINAKAPSPLTLNNGFIKKLKNLPRVWAISVFESSSVAIKKGNREGTTDVAHKVNPCFAEGRLYDENIISPIVNNRNIIGKKCFFI